jgi:hypothetical protein
MGRIVAPASLPGWRNDPADPLRGLDGRALLDAMAAHLDATFPAAGRSAAVDRLVCLAGWVADCPTDDHEKDELRRELALALLASPPPPPQRRRRRAAT